jgi:hypothetical protein
MVKNIMKSGIYFLRAMIRFSPCKCVTLCGVGFLFLLSCTPQPCAQRTIQAERTRFKAELINTTIEAGLSQPLTQKTEAIWEGAFWGMGLARYKSEHTGQAIRQTFQQWNSLSPGFQRALLEVVYTMYPRDFVAESETVYTTTTNEKLFAMAALQVLRAKNGDDAGKICEEMDRHFPHHDTHPILRMLSCQMRQVAPDQPAKPPIGDLLAAPYEPGKPVVFSLQRKNRRYSGLAIIRNADGKFQKINHSTYFSVPQLALSSSDLPGYLSNGDTPQGIFSVQGFGQSANVFIGPTPNVQLVLPFEVKPFEYFHTANMSDTVWTRERYESLLPASWRNYLPIHTAFYAGEAGRSEILAHGTTINPEFYRGEPFFPNTPTMGCLSASESWSAVNGKRIASDQQRLVDAMKKAGFKDGFLVVVELDDEQRAVTIADVLPMIISVEK